MKKTAWIVLCFICVFSFGCKQKDSDVIRVGAAIALTGYGSDFGQSENNAIELLKEKYGKGVEFYIEERTYHTPFIDT